jgi:hypothetical protein
MVEAKLRIPLTPRRFPFLGTKPCNLAAIELSHRLSSEASCDNPRLMWSSNNDRRKAFRIHHISNDAASSV